MNRVRTYLLGIVGEASYQAQIRCCRSGQSVEIFHEPGNPHDSFALAVVTSGGETIGYVPRDCWLQDAIHEEGKGCDATIRSINTAANGMLGVVLDVSLNTNGVSERAFSETQRQSTRRTAQEQSRPPAKNWLARFLGID